MIQVLFISFTRAQIETLGRLLAIFLGSFVSPTWFLLKQSLSPYINIDLLMQKDIGLMTFVNLIGQLESFGPRALMYELIPSLFLCTLASLCFFVLCGYIGKYAARYVA